MDKALVWLRRDLRDVDNAALAAALTAARQVYTLFVFDSNILDELPADDRRLAFIHASLIELDAALRGRGGALLIRHGAAVEAVTAVAAVLGVDAVFCARDYEPPAKARDAHVASALAAQGCRLHHVCDHALFDGDTICKDDGAPYAVFTPYRRRWREHYAAAPLSAASCGSGMLADPGESVAPGKLGQALPALADLGFAEARLPDGVQPGMSGAAAQCRTFFARLAAYADERDFPAIAATSNLSVHLRFGTISPRWLALEAWRRLDGAAAAGASAWLDELIWRDFFFMILDRHPQVVQTAYQASARTLQWDAAPQALSDWQAGRTGYPLVDAGMRQLRDEGTMHNRVRMVTASFLVKDLGIDWRHGEAWFARQLLDFDLAANNGNWQWAASTGCDAVPYFRIFNPVTQSRRFDPEGAYIRRYVPELANVPARWIHAPWRMDQAAQSRCGVVIGRDYPPPCVDHAAARQRTLARYRQARGASADGDALA